MLVSRRGILAAMGAMASGRGRFFRIGQARSRVCLVDPSGQPFFSLAMNHIDSAPLRSGEVWQRDFGNDIQRWLERVRRDLLDWGFNSAGWVQEYVAINDQHHRHSRSFTPEEYRWLAMPYCHLLPFIESHGWEIETRLPRIDSSGFAEWCDYVARDQCVRFRDDARLIGYFYSDVPAWVSTNKDNEWRGALFDPEKLKSASGRQELTRLASHYYRTIHDTIHRYDPNHLIFGDRYNAQRPLPEEIVRAALPWVDVLSFQSFAPASEIRTELKRWADLSGKPVLLADAAHFARPFTPGWPPAEDRRHDPAAYGDALNAALDVTACVGYHLCGAYLKNNARRYGFRDSQNRIEPYVVEMARNNRAAAARFAKESTR